MLVDSTMVAVAEARALIAMTQGKDSTGSEAVSTGGSTWNDSIA